MMKRGGVSLSLLDLFVDLLKPGVFRLTLKTPLLSTITAHASMHRPIAYQCTAYHTGMPVSLQQNAGSL